MTNKRLQDLKSSLEKIVPATTPKTIEDVIWFWRYGALGESNVSKVRQGNSSYISALDLFPGVKSLEAVEDDMYV